MKYDIPKITREAIELGAHPDDAFDVAIEACCIVACVELGIAINFAADIAHLAIHQLAGKIEHQLISTLPATNPV